MKTALIGAGIGALAGVIQLLCFELLALYKLDTHPTALGLAMFAVPSVVVAAACGTAAAMLFRVIRPRRLTAAVLTMILYWGFCWLFSVALAAVIRRSPGVINGAGLMGLPVLMVALWILGVLLMIPTAVVIRRAVRSEVGAA